MTDISAIGPKELTGLHQTSITFIVAAYIYEFMMFLFDVTAVNTLWPFVSARSFNVSQMTCY